MKKPHESPSAERAAPAALDTAVTTLTIPGLGLPHGIFVLPDGTLLVSSKKNTILQLPPSGRLATIAGHQDEEGELKDGRGISARFNRPGGLTVDRAGNVVVADFDIHALRTVTKEGAVVSTLAGNGKAGLLDGQGPNARFNNPHSVVVAANGDLIVSDQGGHSLRVVTAEGAVRTLVGNGQAGFADGQGADARFNCPTGLAMDTDGNLLVVDTGNGAIRLVTMGGAVSTVAGNGENGFADGEGAAARFNQPIGIVIDGKGAIVVADKNNHRLRKIVGGHVTTLAGSSEAGTSDGAGAGVRFNKPKTLALDERGRLLVTEFGREDSLRVEASLAAPLWMGPVEEAVVTRCPPRNTLLLWCCSKTMPRCSRILNPSWQTWCWSSRESVSPRTGVCLQRGASTSGGCSCRGCRKGGRRVGCRRSSWEK
jgi:sugar lactone lactonase YvrE